LIDNFVNNKVDIDGFSELKPEVLKIKNGLISMNRYVDSDLKTKIINKLKQFKIDIDEKDISIFNPDWIVTKKNTGVYWTNQ
jgi:hypothetical protein